MTTQPPPPPPPPNTPEPVFNDFAHSIRTALAVVMLIPRSNNVWMIATHRFIEVTVGILVGLASVALWPEPKSAS